MITLTKIHNEKFNNLVDRHYARVPHYLPYKVGYGKTFTMVAKQYSIERLQA
ncbi:hypothetical protein [Synechococcus sp. PCC 7502]|uniref:hypothetical protein n=1 Tax=Synechococcus sp. PCC 7502 TaxID=1173263 RepID=UPI001AEFCA67|nr:hypothetical protein [Synechococcus sp. PCC 7502]